VTAETTDDSFLGGRLVLAQPRKGYRAGLDAVLLAAAVPEGDGLALDMGCGVGAVMLCAQARLPGWKWTGLERDAAMAELAADNIARNGVTGQVQVETGDAFSLPSSWQNRFDLIVSNPPYFAPGEISAPAAGRAAAWLNSGGLKA